MENQEEKIRKNRLKRMEKLKRILASKPQTEYYPKFLEICETYPKVCPYDGQKLVTVNHPIKEGYSGKPGLCCLFCSRVYWLKKQRNQYYSRIERLEKRERQLKKQIEEQKKLQKYLNLPDHFDKQPATLILQAKICTKKTNNDVKCISIVFDEKEQSTQEGIYWIGRALPSAILVAIGIAKKSFQYKDNWYRIVEYHLFSKAKKYLNIISRFCNPANPQTVYIFAQKNIQHYNSDNYETVTAMIPCMGKRFPIPITVYYEKTTHMCFMNEVAYLEAKQNYDLPYIRLRFASMAESFSYGFGELKQHSELYLLGYSVNRTDGLSTDERRSLLRKIMDGGILTKAEIMNHLEWLISMRNSQQNMVNAISEWKSDLAFVESYDVISQRKIWIKEFKNRLK